MITLHALLVLSCGPSNCCLLKFYGQLLAAQRGMSEHIYNPVLSRSKIANSANVKPAYRLHSLRNLLQQKLYDLAFAGSYSPPEGRMQETLIKENIKSLRLFSSSSDEGSDCLVAKVRSKASSACSDTAGVILQTHVTIDDSQYSYLPSCVDVWPSERSHRSIID